MAQNNHNQNNHVDIQKQIYPPQCSSWTCKCTHFIINRPSYLKLYNEYYHYHQILGYLVVC